MKLTSNDCIYRNLNSTVYGSIQKIIPRLLDINQDALARRAHSGVWVRQTHVGFGLMGEQGAKSIHTRFNILQEPDPVKHMLLIGKDHLLIV